MSQPVQEPTTYRTISRQGFVGRQLERRPRPISDAGCGCPWDTAFANCSTGGGSTGTVNDNTTTDIIFDEISIATGSAAFAVRTAVPSFRPLKAVLNGWYIFFLNFEWSGSPYTDVRTYALYQNSLFDNCGDQNVVQSASAPFINAAYNGSYGPLYLRGEDIADSYFKITVHQNSGSVQTVTGVLFTLMYLGPDLDPARMPPF